MYIAFDAKRAFQNDTGLGNYSRILISSLVRAFPEHEYYLAAPKITDLYKVPDQPNIHLVSPKKNLLKSLWRSAGILNDLKRLKIDLYHGLSHEIPVKLQRTSIRTVVTIHDLIFERYPSHYPYFDRIVYRSKFKYACRYSNQIIAISAQTKQDLINLYGIPADRITICYQSCDQKYMQVIPKEQREATMKKYHLPNQYFLFVGSVTQRKNLMLICKAMHALNGKLDIPVVVIGGAGDQMQSVQQYIRQKNLSSQFIFLSHQYEPDRHKQSLDMPALYQGSMGLIYPSIFEGYGLPVLEALNSRIPVITSNISSMPEAGGDAALYIDPFSVDSLADAMLKVADDEHLRQSMVTKGMIHAQKFSQEACATKVMEVYQSLF